MRRGRQGSVWRDDSGRVIALSLGADYCAEHEWGIKGINTKLGISGPDKIDLSNGLGITDKILDLLKLKKPKAFGLAARTMTKDYEPVHNLDTKGLTITSGYGKDRKNHKMWALAVIENWKKNYFDFENVRENYYYSPEREELIGHWSEDAFCVFIEDKSVISEFIDAFKKKDIAVWLGGGGAFKNAGLVIAIASRVPEDFSKSTEDADLDQFELTKAAANTGIHDILKKADRRYYALSPRWKDDNKEEVIFWLNPMEQNKYEHGWYGVDELKLWARGEGKIIKKAEV
jgi:hypothetical protein